VQTTSPQHERETRLLREIGELATQVRALRTRSAGANGTQIKALEMQSRAAWAELRTLRAAPDGAPPSTAGGGTRG